MGCGALYCLELRLGSRSGEVTSAAQLWTYLILEDFPTSGSPEQLGVASPTSTQEA